MRPQSEHRQMANVSSSRARNGIGVTIIVVLTLAFVRFAQHGDQVAGKNGSSPEASPPPTTFGRGMQTLIQPENTAEGVEEAAGTTPRRRLAASRSAKWIPRPWPLESVRDSISSAKCSTWTEGLEGSIFSGPGQRPTSLAEPSDATGELANPRARTLCPRTSSG